MARRNEGAACPVCGQARAAGELNPGDFVTDGIADAIRREQPGWSRDDVVCGTCVSRAKAAHLREVLRAEVGALTPIENRLIDDLRERKLVSVNPDVEDRRARTGSERLADRVAAAIGSWRFSGAVLLALLLWVSANIAFQPFDPFPVIVLAVISAALASLAALQGPILLMSQRRQLKRDRLSAQNDYRVNLKAELEIRHLDEKLDRVLAQQRQVLLAQIEILDRLIARRVASPGEEPTTHL